MACRRSAIAGSGPRCNRLGAVASGKAGLVKTLRSICRTALPLLLCAPCAALAQAPPAPAGEAVPAEVAFSADQLVYDRRATL